MGLLDGVPVLSDVEDAAGTVATGTVDTVVADPANALLGVNADNMGIFEEQAVGSKLVSFGTLGLAGEGGLFTDILMPGQGAPGSERGTGVPTQPSQRQDQDQRQGFGPLVLVVGAAAALLAIVGLSE